MNLMVCEKLKARNSQAGIVKFKLKNIQAYLAYLQYTNTTMSFLPSHRANTCCF